MTFTLKSFRLGALLSELDNLDHNIGPKYLMECLPNFTVLYLGSIKSRSFGGYVALNHFFSNYFQSRGITMAKEIAPNLKKITERALRHVTRDKSTTRKYKTLLNS